MRINIKYYKETDDTVYISDKFAPLFQTDASEWTNAEIDLADELNEFVEEYVEKYGVPLFGYDITEE